VSLHPTLAPLRSIDFARRLFEPRACTLINFQLVF
jgi:hypothetical protein